MNEALRSRIAQLPPLPQAVLALQATLQDESASVADCALRIRQDPALTARLLRLANSAFYGVPGRVTGIDDAVQLIGLRSLRLLAMTAAVTLQFSVGSSRARWLDRFWRHALAVAHLAQGLAELRGQPVERAYIAGLLHDIGWLVLATRTGADPDADPDADRAGDDHAAAGAAVARHWHLPTAVAEAIAGHHAPAGGASSATSLEDIVHVADALAHGHGFGHDPEEPAPPIDAGAWQRLGGGALDLTALTERVRRAVDDTCLALGVAAAPPQPEEMPA